MNRVIVYVLFLIVLAGTAVSQTTIEAEDAFLFSAYVRDQYSGYTGTGYVDVIDKTGAYLEFIFRRDAAATDTITMYYANGGSSRNFNVTLNDVSAGSITLPATGGWTTWSSRSIAIALQAGTNRLRFTTTTNGGYPNVDRIIVAGAAATLMYKLTLTKSGSGAVSASPSATYYDAGTSVELTATATGNSFFKRWMGGNDSPASPYNLTMDGHKTLVGVFLDTTGTSGFSYQPSPIGFASVNALGNNGATGGDSGETAIVTTGDDLWSLMLLRADASKTLNLPPLTVYVVGILSPGSLFGANKMLDVKDAYDISIIGVGNDATITGFGLLIVRSSNIIVRNIKFASCPDDGISIQADDDESTGHHIWVDHCSFTNTPPAGYPVAGTYDGSLDVTHTAAYVTLSWNHFIKHDKNCLMGHSDSQTSDVAMKVSYHHNYFDSTIQRNPRVRYGKAHVFNNYYRKNHLYGVSSNLEADVLVEGNYFVDVPIPTETSRDGSPPGDVVERNNIFVSSGTAGTRGTAFEASTYYSYSLDSANLIPAMVSQYSGSGKYDFSYSGSTASYTLTVNATNGTVAKNPDQPTYTSGTNVELTASPSPTYYFVNWTGDVVPSQAQNNPLTVTMDDNKTLTANFTNITHVLTVNAANGSVVKSPDLGAYPQGSSVELTASPSGGYFFVSWSGDVPSGHEADNPLTITMDGDKTVTANFSNQTYSLTTNATNGTVTRNPNQATYNSGSTVELTAVPSTGYHFVSWSGDTIGIANPFTVLMNGNKTVTANFAINTYTLSITSLNGSVTKNPDQANYDHGTSVTLTATPNGGYMFSNWSGDASGTSNQTTVLMDANKSVTANFQSLGSMITSNGTGGGDWSLGSTWQGGVAPTGTYNVFIADGDSVYNSTAVSCASLTIQSGGKLSTNAAITISGVFAIQANGWYYHGASGTFTLPGSSRALDDASTVVYNYTGGSASMAGGTFGNLTIIRSSNTNLSGAITVNGNLTLNISSASSGLRGSSGSTSRTNTVAGNVYLLSGTLSCLDAGTGSAVSIWDIGGDVYVNGAGSVARLSPFSSGTAAGSGTMGIFNIGGNLTVSGGRLQYASNSSTQGLGIINLSGNLDIDSGSAITDNLSIGNFAFNFTGSGVQTVTLGMNFSMATNVFDTVKNGAIVVFDNGNYTWGSTAGTAGKFVVNGSLELKGNSTLTGAGSFELNPGGTLTVGNANGITASGATGNVQVTGTRTFNSEASYEYRGTAGQVTGDGLPATVENLTINNESGVTLSSPVTITGELSLLSGDLDLNGNNVTLGSSALLSETPGNTVKGDNGIITTTRDLNAPDTSTNIAGMGIKIGTSASMGSTIISRGHAVQAGLDSGSIARYFEITPETNTGLNATIIFNYDDSELEGIQESSLMLFQSTDAGTTWSQEGGSVHPTNNTITLNGVDDFSRWTASAGTTTITHEYSFANAWNLISVPLTVNDKRKVSLFPASVSNAFAFLPGGGYVTRDTLETNTGYWLKFSGAQSVTIHGYARVTDTIQVEEGWNIVGALSVPVDVDDVIQYPPGIKQSLFYGFTSGYVPADTLQPGKGYWIKVSTAGSLILPQPAGKIFELTPVNRRK